MRAFLVLLACGVALIVLWTREPRYNGRSLTSWLQQYADASVFDTKQLTEARNAIRNIGTERSLPTLLKLITAKDGSVDNWAFNLKVKFGLNLHWRYASTRQAYALSGFEALGTNAAPAVDSLTKLLNDRDGRRAMPAFQCLEKIGKPAEDALCQCLTNRNPAVRHSAVDAVAGVTDDVETFISRVKICLNDSDSAVRVTAVRAISFRYPEARKQVVPYLVTLLDDPHQDVRTSATYALKQLDPQAAANVGIK